MRIKTLPGVTMPQFLKIVEPRAIDGDTIIGHIELPLGILARRRIRLKGFYGPEIGGPNPDAAKRAMSLLQAALDSGECHLKCLGLKEDRYGRLLATLLIDGHEVHGGLVLGQYQLSEDAHKREVEIAATAHFAEQSL